MYRPRRSILREKLTARQKQVYDFIRDFIREHAYPPSIREIQHHFGLKSTKGVKDHIDRLVDKDYLRRDDGAARALEIVDDKSIEVRKVPLVGTVAAGLPLLASENIEDYLPVSAQTARTRDMFYLRVQGDSMIDEAILEDDLVLVRPQPFVEQGEVAVVRVGDEATVKKFYRVDDRIELHPANPDYSPMIFDKDSDEVTVVGKVVAVYRTLE
ncbi:MAG: transcriptional repressor LexA [Candidatus Aegiribacteria sp.]|nr:transcriptional repressor LexA [Candidatus Aegiribacteria sp.]MBD3295032.1 transcriptional repressor LexA [Candidatus Fermentibacteria bacterium]